MKATITKEEVERVYWELHKCPCCGSKEPVHQCSCSPEVFQQERPKEIEVEVTLN